MNKEFSKMKVAELRKFVSENQIFSGGLSTMKKKDLIDKIYDSEWYNINCRPVEELSEKEILERKLKMLEKQLKSEKSVEAVEEPKQEAAEPQVVEDDLEPVEDDLNDRIQKAIQEALLKQKNEMMTKLFG